MPGVMHKPSIHFGLREEDLSPPLASPGPRAAPLLASWRQPYTSQMPAVAFRIAFFAQQSANLSQHRPCISPAGLQTLFWAQFWRFSDPKWPASRPQVGQSGTHFGLRNPGFSWGLALGAHKPAKISQHKANFSPDSLKSLL